MKLLPGSAPMTGWNVESSSSSNNVSWLGPKSPFLVKAGEGDFFLDLTGYQDSPPYLGVSQTIATEMGRTYRVTFEVGTTSDYNSVAPSVSVAVSGNPTVTNTVTVNGHNRWQTFASVFTATVTNTTVTFRGANPGSISYVGLDNVKVTPTSAENLLVNGSFENGAFIGDPVNHTMLLETGSTALTGWTIVGLPDGNNLAWEGAAGTPFPVTAGDGNYMLDLSGFSDVVPYGGISQTVSTVAGKASELSFEVGSDVAYATSAPGVVVSVSGVPEETYFVDRIGTGRWQDFSQTFTATTNRTAVTITGVNTTGVIHIGLDNVRLISSGDSPLIFLNPPFVAGGSVQIEFRLIRGWSPSFTLLESATVDGPWTVNNSATWSTLQPGSSYSFVAPFSGATRFYRVRVP